MRHDRKNKGFHLSIYLKVIMVHFCDMISMKAKKKIRIYDIKSHKCKVFKVISP